jgi:hypothetical protein
MLLSREKNPAVAAQMTKMVSFYGEKIKSDDSAFVFYRLGKTFLARGDRQRAFEYFRRAFAQFNEGHEYKTYAGRLISSLEKEQ